MPLDAAPREGFASLPDRVFVGGPENALLRVAAESIIRPTGSRPDRFQPLVLVGPSGAGKSLAARALARSWREEPSDAVVQIAASDFARKLRDALQTNDVSEFRRRFQQAPLIVVEDVHELAGKPHAETELASIIDSAADNHRVLIVTMRDDRPRLSAALESRLAGGLTIALRSPGPEARRILIDALAQRHAVRLTDDAAELLSRSATGGFARLNLLVLELSRRAEPGAAARVEDAAEAIERLSAAARPTLKRVASVVARHHKLPVSELIGRSRRRSVAAARAMAFYLSRELTGRTLAEIGSHFGGRDHTTVLHSWRSVAEGVASDPAIRQTAEHLRRALRPGE